MNSGYALGVLWSVGVGIIFGRYHQHHPTLPVYIAIPAIWFTAGFGGLVINDLCIAAGLP